MAEPTITAEQANQIMTVYNTLSHDAKFYVFIIIVLLIIGWGVNLVLKHRAVRQERAEKDARANLYIDQMNKLGESIRTHMEQDARNMVLVGTALDKVEQAVKSVLDKADGLMTIEDSLRVVEVYFSAINTEAARIVARSMEENDFDSRKEYVARKVRTAVSEVIEDARANLAEFNLAFDPRMFFRSYDSTVDGAERFVLCDQVWATVMPLYNHDAPLNQRLEEMRLLLLNNIRDQFSHISKRVWDRKQKQSASSLEHTINLPVK